MSSNDHDIWNSSYEAAISVTILGDLSVCNRMPESNKLGMGHKGEQAELWQMSVRWADSLDKGLVPAEELAG